MSKLLLDEQPLLIMKALAVKIGLNESIILQQIHYWLEINRKANKNFRDGYYWTFNSYTEWEKQFPFWSKRTIQRAMANLENLKLVKVDNFNKLKIDRTKWYRIDYKILEILDNMPCGQNGTINMTEWHNQIDKLELPLPKINTKTNSEIKNNKGVKSKKLLLYTFLELNLYELEEDAMEVVQYYISKYYMYFDIELKYTVEEWKDIFDNILYSSVHGDLEQDILIEAIDKHFETKYEHNEMYLLHNFKGTTKDNRLYEVGIL